MANRRSFIRNTFFGALFLGVNSKIGVAKTLSINNFESQDIKKFPLVLSTWNHGLAANEAAWKLLVSGKKALDAVEKGVMVSEADPQVTSVGLGGRPDASGNVTLDACIMDSKGNAGAVGCLQHILHPISVARKVMEKSPHVLITGNGALKFALDNGFSKSNLLTADAKEAYKNWKKSGASYAPMANWENHDTIGLIAIDNEGDIAGACTTSGMAFKHSGRIGDSPIIGAGLFVDNEIGAATATGEGEAVMKTLGSFLIVEMMRNGMSPQEACEAAIQRLATSGKVHKQMQIGYIALNKNGMHGAFALRSGFQYALYIDSKNQLFDAPYLLEWE